MKKSRKPRENKELDYERQHFSPGKYDKAFRRQWPKKKARTERSFRRAANQPLRNVNEESAEEGEIRALSETRKPIAKWDIMNLREKIRLKKEKRESMVNARKNRQNKS